jgi:hypothetical protein
MSWLNVYKYTTIYGYSQYYIDILFWLMYIFFR